tara:strand:+ start:4789 stop:6186 length:1398 start_codon:yes stop_codon:yes gene_type:complete
MIDSILFKRFGENIAAITDDGSSYQYNEIFNFIKELGKVLEPRSLVFSLSDNSIGSLVGYFAFLFNKTPPLILDSKINNEKINDLINIYDPKYIWIEKGKFGSLNKGNVVKKLLDYCLVEISTKSESMLNEDLALLLTTSGSTGSPKLVKLSYDNIYSNAKSISSYLKIDYKEKPITSLPMHYSFGLSIINSHIIKGSTLLLTNSSIMEKRFWEFLKLEKATSLSGVPYTFLLLKKLRFFKMDLPHLGTLTQAGGKLSDDLTKDFSNFCFKTEKSFIIMYGQTEASPRMSYLPHKDSIKKLGSIGVPIPGGEFSLIDEKENVIYQDNIIGELVYKGENVSMGYAESNKDLSIGDENKGILYTGDIAKKDEDGYYYIIGRKKRFIKLFGNRINLDETEELVKKIVSECACLGQDDKMVIYIEEKKRIEDVKEFISAQLRINSLAFIVKYIDQIPKNSSGKTLYKNL